tara:strand:- start:411 stop:746 length:336 start_codon:yes stop_codon:yes gene_type:complete
MQLALTEANNQKEKKLSNYNGREVLLHVYLINPGATSCHDNWMTLMPSKKAKVSVMDSPGVSGILVGDTFVRHDLVVQEFIDDQGEIILDAYLEASVLRALVVSRITGAEQ